MQIFIDVIDLNIQEAIEIRPYIPTTVVDVSITTTTQKPRDKWTEEDRRRIQYDLKAKNIITSAPQHRQQKTLCHYIYYFLPCVMRIYVTAKNLIYTVIQL